MMLILSQMINLMELFKGEKGKNINLHILSKTVNTVHRIVIHKYSKFMSLYLSILSLLTV